MKTTALILSISIAIAAPAAALPASPPASAAGTRPALFKDSRQSLAIARAQGRKEVAVLIAAKPGAAAAVAADAKRLGGDVRYRDDEIGYLRIRVPIDNANALAESAGVQAATVDYDDSYPNRLAAGRPAQPMPDPPDPPKTEAVPDWPPILSDYPLVHPYSPLKDLAAADFQREHPTWDGRGVTIGVLDGNFDMLLPEFQTAYTADGKTVPKVADYLNVTDPRDDADINPQWVDMKTVVRSSGGTVSYGGKTFQVPRDGTYRIGFFNERRFNMDSNASYIDQDIDRNGNPKGDDGLFGVLWDEATNDVWVDTNRDLDFKNETALTDYAKRPLFGVFGKDDPETPWRDTIGFAVQTDKKNKFVSINVGIYQHCTTIMGSVVGNREPKGRIQGVAPGARLVSLFYGVSNEHGLIEGMIVAFRHPAIDVIVLEQSVAIASIPYLLADATHPISVIAQRLTERYGKLMFVPGDNAPAFGFVAEDGLAPGVVSVGGYQSKESYRINNGFIPEHDDNLHWGAGSHGPSGNGALKPDLIAPSGQMGTEVGYRKGAGQKGLYRLPPGYSVDGGTSTATPMAAGAAALVVSAAKQTGVPHDAARLKAALTGSARYIANLAAHEQGNGLIQVGPAYALLQKYASTAPLSIAVQGPVRTKLSPLLQPPNTGVGLYEREGWKLGDQATRDVTLTRKNGPAGMARFSITWLGNDGTFSAPDSVDLPLGQPVSVPVTIQAKGVGAHSAILQLGGAASPGPAGRVLNTIVVPLRPAADNQYEVTTQVTPPVPGNVSAFVEVPPGSRALAFSVSSPDVTLSLIGPDKDALYPCPFDTKGAPNACATANPQPGVWEINVDNTKMVRNFDFEFANPMKSSPVTVTARLVGVDVGSAAAPSLDRPFTLDLQNRLAKVTAAASSSGVASVRRQTGSIARGAQDLYEIDVPEGATSLRASLEGEGAADLDLYVLDCTPPEKPKEPAEAKEKEKGNKSPMAPPALCAPTAKAADVGPGGDVRITGPKKGRWVVVVDAFDARGTARYTLVDAITHPSYGAIAVMDPPDARSPDARWTAQAVALGSKDAPAGRRLEACVDATSTEIQTTTGRYGQGDRVALPLGSAEIPLGSRAAEANGRGNPGR
jgi:hypothetical protein